MKRLRIGIDDELAERLEHVAPARSKRRSAFIRRAIRRAIWEVEERATAEAYTKDPAGAAETYVGPTVWDELRRVRGLRRKK